MNTNFNIQTAFACGVCRIEPENNIHIILEAFSQQPPMPLLLIGNWEHSEYSRKLETVYGQCNSITLSPPIYDLTQLNAIRSKCTLYLHGHSCGGTNPSLIEAMYLGLAIAAYDVNFNRETTENKALYYSSVDELKSLCQQLTPEKLQTIALEMKKIADRRYTWKRISECYARLF